MPSLCFTTPAARAECLRDLFIGSIRFVMGALIPGLRLKCLTSKASCVGHATAALMRTLGPAALTPKVRELRAREAYIEI